MKKTIYAALLALSLVSSGCNDFLDEQKPQGTLDQEQVFNPQYIEIGRAHV